MNSAQARVSKANGNYFSHSKNSGYNADRQNIAVGQTAEAVLQNISHADRVTVNWRTQEADPKAASVRYSYRKGYVERPIGKDGKPVGIDSCELEYLMAGFLRKFVTLQFDENDKVADIRDWTLD